MAKGRAVVVSWMMDELCACGYQLACRRETEKMGGELLAGMTRLLEIQ
jgi:hypothetical protein